MKVIQLDKRHSLLKRGYVYAFKFETWNKQASQIEHIVREVERMWDFTFWGKSVATTNGNRRPYYIGVKSHTTVTLVLLKLE